MRVHTEMGNNLVVTEVDDDVGVLEVARPFLRYEKVCRTCEFYVREGDCTTGECRHSAPSSNRFSWDYGTGIQVYESYWCGEWALLPEAEPLPAEGPLPGTAPEVEGAK